MFCLTWFTQTSWVSIVGPSWILRQEWYSPCKCYYLDMHHTCNSVRGYKMCPSIAFGPRRWSRQISGFSQSFCDLHTSLKLGRNPRNREAFQTQPLPTLTLPQCRHPISMSRSTLSFESSHWMKLTHSMSLKARETYGSLVRVHGAHGNSPTRNFNAVRPEHEYASFSQIKA